MVMPGRGDTAPAFSLDGTDGTGEGRRSYSLEEFRATPWCWCSTRPTTRRSAPCSCGPTPRTSPRSPTSGAHVLAISPQSVADHDAFATENGGFAFPLLADVEKAVGRDYGILGPVGFYRRSVFVIDREGVVRWAHRATAGLTFRPVDEIVDVVRALDA